MKYQSEISHLCNDMNAAFGSPKVAELSRKHDKVLSAVEYVEANLDKEEPKQRAKTVKLLKAARAGLDQLRCQINEEMMKK